MTADEGVQAIVDYGFTERQAGLVLDFAGNPQRLPVSL